MGCPGGGWEGGTGLGWAGRGGENSPDRFQQERAKPQKQMLYSKEGKMKRQPE